MVKLVKKYLKVSLLPILLIIVLLIVQAVGDLKLPDYTSSIVNVGIQQSGIAYAAPQYVRESEMRHILAFMYDESDSVAAVPTKIKQADYEKIISLITQKADKDTFSLAYQKQGKVYTLISSSAALEKALQEPLSLFWC